MKVAHLTEREKRDELSKLATLIPNANHRHNNGLDADMVPWLDRFNALPGIVTVQSCEGHVFRYKGNKYCNRACLAFRYSRGVGLRLREMWESIPEMSQDAHLSMELREPPRSGRREEWLMIWFDGRSKRKPVGAVLGPLLKWLTFLKEK